MSDYSEIFKEAAVGQEDYNIAEEIKLIKEYQRTGDRIALRKLRDIYRGTIQSVTSSAPKYGVDQASVPSLALNFFIQAIKSYDETKTAGAKPSTFIHGTMYKLFQKENYKYQDTSRKSEQLARESHDVYNAKVKLELEGKFVDPLSIRQAVKQMKGKDIALNNINRIEALNRTEYSGGVTTSGETGEVLKFEDLSNVDDTDADKIFRDSVMMKRIGNAINKLSPTEANIFKDMHGFGGHEKIDRLDLLALNNNLTSRYMAKKIYNNAASKIKNLIE
jgi:hypothetical protein